MLNWKLVKNNKVHPVNVCDFVIGLLYDNCNFVFELREFRFRIEGKHW